MTRTNFVLTRRLRRDRSFPRFPPIFFAGPLALATLVAVGCGSNGGDTSTTGTSSSSSGTGGSAGGGGGPDVVIDQIISTPSQTESEHEAQIVVTNSGRVVVSWVDASTNAKDYYHVGYRVSDDRGTTWGPVSSIPLPADDNIGFNTTLAADAAGTVFLSWAAEHVATSGERSHQRVYLSRLDPGEAAFAAPTEMTDPSEDVGVYDQPGIAVMKDGGLLLTYGQYPPDYGSSWIVMQHSADGGKTWTKSAPGAPVDAGFYQNLAHACVAPDSGRAYLFLLDTNKSGGVLWRSPDGGKTWNPSDQKPIVAPGEKFAVPLDGNCVAAGDEVWAVYGVTDEASTSQKIPRLTHIKIAHSSDGGATIDARYKVEDAAAGAYFLLPRIASEGAGTLGITYYAGAGSGDLNASYRHARSTDGGKTFGPSTVVRTPILYDQMRSTATWFGDYMGLTWNGGSLFGAYIDNTGGASHIVFHREPTGG
ncbi:Hypothetical protein A7982_04951 [Minicystis rosea]|nr:Hypothetical protein A7982_04951 [Minicystis rosea]